jgi:hypothetical protein
MSATGTSLAEASHRTRIEGSITMNRYHRHAITAPSVSVTSLRTCA